MNAKFKYILIALNLLVGGNWAVGQSSVFTYQGRVTDNGTNFNGSGQFEFALVTSTNLGSQATAIATNTSGFITGIGVVNPGDGYTTVPTVTISGGGGSGATATATVSGGRITGIAVNTAGSGYTSTPTVMIAPPPPDIAYTTYWSNDGTSVNGGEPSHAVNVVVDEGLFTVALGDTNLANMTEIPAAIFTTQANLQLLIWFNDGVNGFALLTPAQNLMPTPYADMANYASNVLGTVSAGQLSGTIAPALLPNSVLTNGAANVTLTGTFAANGADITNINISSLGPPGTFTLVSQLFFAPGITLGVGPYPFSVVAVDINGDGQLDLVSANTGGNTLTVLTNNGGGGFESNATITVGRGPISVVTADVNGDGFPDLICANNGSNTLTVVTNNRHGGFGFSATLLLPTNAGPYYVTAADINGDGFPDLIASDTLSDTNLTVFTNNGSGVFGSNATLVVGREPNQVAVADINGDGFPDLISANYVSGTLSVLTNNGHGVFGSNATLVVAKGPGSVSVVATNVHGSGLPDLICTDVYDNAVVIFTNNGSGIFGSNTMISVGNHPQSVIAVDLTGDGLPDLVTANASTTTLTVLTNNGSGGFGSNATITVGLEPWQVIAADLNGSGKPALISANSGSSTLTEVRTFPGWLGFGVAVDGSSILNLNASELTSGTVPLAQLPSAVVTNTESGVTLAGNFSGDGSGLTSVAQLAADQTFFGDDVFEGGFAVNTGAGTITVEGQFVPTLDVSGGAVSGHMRLRNALEIWPNDAATAGGYLDVRNLTGAQTIILTGTSGNITATSVTQTSDRNAKENFTQIDPRDVLDRVASLPISKWNFKVDTANRHIGPMAQDFHAAFDLGDDDKHITTVDEEGVALAAIQGLNQKVEEKEKRIQEQAAEIADLKQQISRLSQMMKTLNERFNETRK